ncbi:MAG: lipopolysaccharide kinase InaA family protein [Clostridium sp.]|nr:lipopolysaccharide kinase InaA family protein [Clostridium sp.]
MVYEIAPGMESAEAFVRRLIDSGVPVSARRIYDGRRNKVYALGAPVGVGFEELNVKAFRVPVLINRFVYGRLRRGKARRAFDNARRLTAMGIRTAAPVAFVEERGLLYGRSYFVSEQLPAQWRVIRGVEQWDGFDGLLRDLARFLLSLHRRQVWMKDFSPGNVLMRVGEDGSREFAIIDINRMEFGVTDWKKFVTNFQAIFDTPEATARFARSYAEVAEMGQEAADRLVADAVEAFRAKHRQIERKRRLRQLFR